MDAVLCVVMCIFDIQHGGLAEIVICLFLHAKLGSHNTENTGGERRVVGGQLFVVFIGIFNSSVFLLILKQKMGQNCVCLFAHLIAVIYSG